MAHPGFVDVTLCAVITTIGYVIFCLICKTCYSSILFSAFLCELLDVVLTLVLGLKLEVFDLIKPFVD